jgi:hypothetical protein
MELFWRTSALFPEASLLTWPSKTSNIFKNYFSIYERFIVPDHSEITGITMRRSEFVSKKFIEPRVFTVIVPQKIVDPLSIAAHSAPYLTLL